jgi:hypothetical protein
MGAMTMRTTSFAMTMGPMAMGPTAYFAIDALFRMSMFLTMVPLATRTRPMAMAVSGPMSVTMTATTAACVFSVDVAHDHTRTYKLLHKFLIVDTHSLFLSLNIVRFLFMMTI